MIKAYFTKRQYKDAIQPEKALADSIPKPKGTPIRNMPEVFRPAPPNKKCKCGSGKKSKRCCTKPTDFYPRGANVQGIPENPPAV